MSAKTVLPASRDGHSEVARWCIAGAVVLLAHLAIVTSYWLLRPLRPQGAQEAPVVIVDLAPLTVAPIVQMQDLAPGPDLTPPVEPEPAEPPKPEVIDSPKIELAPVENPLVSFAEPKPEIKQGSAEAPKQQTPPPEAQTAPPKAEQAAPASAAARAGSNDASSVQPSWIRRLLAHINRFKQYPPVGRSRREEGTVTLGFTIDREGHVLARHVAKSSGSQALDAEALAMLQRADPLPAFPASMVGASRSFNVPIRFSLR